jgi:signal transduction histidine kinase/ligand-binding sensor domain-containing protein
MSNRSTYCTAAIFLAACVQYASALDPDRMMSQYVRERWGSAQGFAGEVQAIIQTGDGHLWVGTERGLFRFDGMVFRAITGPGAPPASALNAASLAVDSRKDLLVRLPERNLLRYVNGKFENTLDALQPRELAITAMCQGRDGNTLVTGIVQGVLRLKDGRFETIAPVTSLPSSPVISMAEAADGKIWLGTKDAGLFYLDGKRVVDAGMGLPDRRIETLLADGAGVWVGTGAGMVRWNGAALTAEGVPASLRHVAVLAMLTDHQSNLWIGTRTGLVRLNAGGAVIADLGRPEDRSPVSALFEDREGNLWTGGASGLQRWRDGSFTSWGKGEGLPSDHNGPVYTDREGRTWFAPLEGGLYWLNHGKKERISEAGLDSDVVYSITGDGRDLWLGRQHGGLTRLRYRAGEITSETLTQPSGLAQNSVYSVYRSRDGAVWAGTLNGGLSRYRDGKFQNYSIADGLASNTVNSIFEGTDGVMWFATPNGLRALSHDRWRGYTTRDGLPSDNVNCVFEDSRGILWIGTARGLAWRTSTGITSPHDDGDLLRDQILGLAEDKRGSLWIAASNHVLRVDRDRLMRGTLASGDLREYSAADGLRGVEGIRRDRSVVEDTLGQIWFSMAGGLSMVDPARLTNSSVPVIVHIQSVAADNNIFGSAGAIHIPSPPRRITFSYSGLSLWEPDQVRFRYALDGYDHDLGDPTSLREATYTNLGPGDYTFRVIASNPDGVWNPAETTVAFKVLPLFWQTWWFQVAAVLAAGLMVLALYRLRVHQMESQLQVRFEERLAERTRIAQELHDTLLQGFLSASMQLHVAVDSLPPDSPTKPRLGRVLELMSQVIDEGRSALRGLRTQNDISLDLEQAFSRIREEFAFCENVAFRVIVNGQPRRLHPLLRDEVYRIGREALVNAFRHSGASRVDVELRYAPTQMHLVVRDDGCGIDTSLLQSGREGHWGLPGMRERAEKIGGRLRVWSRASAGTEVELFVPGHIAFREPTPEKKTGRGAPVA